MAIPFFSANKKNTGGALFPSFTVDPENQAYSVYLNVFPQTGYRQQEGGKGVGEFDMKNGLNVKLSVDEAADIIQTVRNRGEWTFFHSFGDISTKGSFRYWKVAPAKEGEAAKEGFGLTVNKSGKEVKIGFSLGSAERLSQWFEWALFNIFSIERDADIRKFKNKNSAEKPAKAKEEPAPAPKTETPKPDNSDGWGLDD